MGIKAALSLIPTNLVNLCLAVVHSLTHRAEGGSGRGLPGAAPRLDLFLVGVTETDNQLCQCLETDSNHLVTILQGIWLQLCIGVLNTNKCENSICLHFENLSM